MLEKTYKILVASSVMLLVFVPLQSIPAASAVASTGILEPLYCDPYSQDGAPCNTDTFTWESINDTKKAHPSVPFYVIINPANGFPDCNAQNVNVPDYVRGTDNLTKSGVVVLGYVDTKSTQVSESDVKTQIDNYKNCIGSSVKGIFFDEMSTDANTAHEQYYSNLTAYAKGTDGMTYTVGNPGTQTSSGYIGTVDVLNIFENNVLPTTTDLQTNTFNGTYSKANFSFLSYAQSSLPNQTTINSESNYVGFMYITDDGGATDIRPLAFDFQNPWDQIATYVSTLATELDH